MKPPRMFPDFPTALAALADELGRRKFDPSGYFIVLTPDKYTLHVERALFKGGGALDCEVLTLSRLCRRALGSRKTLSREGGVMLVARAISAVKDSLTYYKHAVKYYDFARETYETLLQMSASQFDPMTAQAKGVTGEKLHDLALIKGEYDRLKTESLDASDRLEELIEAAATSPLVTGSKFYAIGFSNATKLNKAVFGAIAAAAKSFEFFDAYPAEPKKGKTKVYRMPDSVAGYKLAASIVCERVKAEQSPLGYEDISVVCPEPRVLSRVFREYGIPFYADESVTLDKTPPVAAIATLCRMRRSLSSADIIALCKNPFSGCNDRDAERLMCYLNERGIEYGAKSEDINDFDAKRALERAETILGAFSAQEDFIRSARSVIELCDFKKVASDIFADKTDMLTPLDSVLSLIEQYGSGEFDNDANIFFSTARAVSIKSVPQQRGRVTVSDAATFRLSKSRLLIVTDFNEGVLPQTTSDSGLLGDLELAELNGAIEPTAREQNKRSRNELAAIMCNADEVVCTYSSGDGGRRATFLSEFCDGDIDYAAECRTLAAGRRAANSNEYDRLLARHTVTVPSARETAARGMTPYSQSIYSAVGCDDCVAPPFVNVARNVKCDAISVSELTHWFDCPYKRFLLDSVGVAERRKGKTAADFGLVMHAFMKKFVEGPLDCSREAVERVMREGLKEAKLFDDDRAIDAVIADEKIMRDACDYAQANKHVIESGGYVPTLSEYPFGGKIKLGETGASFNGIIDRVDFCGDRARIIDYKTGDKKFNADACRSGRDMQLPLYAAALRAGGADVTGMFYVPLGGLYDNTDRRLSGCMVGDISVAAEYDGKLADGESSDVVHAKFKLDRSGEPVGFNGNVSTSVKDKAEFDAIIDGCIETAGRAVDEISSGYIERSPADGACDYCPFGGLCAEKKIRN